MKPSRAVLTFLLGVSGLAPTCVAQSTTTQRLDFDESVVHTDPIGMEFASVAVTPSQMTSAMLVLRMSQASNPDEVQIFDESAQAWTIAAGISGSGWQTYQVPVDPAYFDEVTGGLRARLVVYFSASHLGTMIDYADLTVEYVACLADVDGNGFVNGDDYDFFASAFDAADAAADLDANGFINGDDYDLFANAFEMGC